MKQVRAVELHRGAVEGGVGTDVAPEGPVATGRLQDDREEVEWPGSRRTWSVLVLRYTAGVESQAQTAGPFAAG